MALFPNRLHALFIFRQCGSDTLQGCSVVAWRGWVVGLLFFGEDTTSFMHLLCILQQYAHTPQCPHPPLLTAEVPLRELPRIWWKGVQRNGLFFSRSGGDLKPSAFRRPDFFSRPLAPTSLPRHVENVVYTDRFGCRIDALQCLTMVLTLSMLARWSSL